MARKLKVYGGNTFIPGYQARTIVAAPSKKRAIELLNEHRCNLTTYTFKDWWTETGNDHEVNIALENPETVWYDLGGVSYSQYFVKANKPSTGDPNLDSIFDIAKRIKCSLTLMAELKGKEVLVEFEEKANKELKGQLKEIGFSLKEAHKIAATWVEDNNDYERLQYAEFLEAFVLFEEK